jgi:hypothetical protein
MSYPPTHGWHGYGAGDLKADHDPMKGDHIAIQRIRDAGQHHRHSEHAKSHGDLAQEDRRGENSAGRMRRVWMSARQFVERGYIVTFLFARCNILHRKPE